MVALVRFEARRETAARLECEPRRHPPHAPLSARGGATPGGGAEGSEASETSECAGARGTRQDVASGGDDGEA